MTRISCAALLFDLDGVLVDSTPAVQRVWARWAARHGFDAAEVVHRAHGRPSITTVREYLPNIDAVEENREIERGEIADLDGIVPLPGALELLRALPRGRWTIVTSCSRRLAEVRLRTSGLPQPEVFVTSSDIRNGKPAPDAYLKGAEVLGLAPQDCVVVEDAAAGVRAGKAAGAKVIGLRTTMPERELREAGVDWLVKDCTAISPVGDQIGGGKLSLLLREDDAPDS
ncbi:MAG: HAD family hydrolase [Candidatus Acidiferrales bacterium]